MIVIDFLLKIKKINGEYYASLLRRLSNEIKKKQPHQAKNKLLFHQDNALVHISVIAVAKINELHFKLHLYAPYSPYSAPSGYYYFPNLKKYLGSQRFANNKEVESALNDFFEELDGSHYKEGIEVIKHLFEKCIEP